MIPLPKNVLPCLFACAMLVCSGIPAPLQAASPPKPPRPTDPFVISTDAATYGKRVSQQIPSIARAGTRWFCMWYGVNKGPVGVSGEGTGCYNTLAYSDDGCVTWKECAWFVPNPAVTAQSVIDNRLFTMPDGSLLILIPVSGQKGCRRSIWSVLLKNPDAKDGKFTFTRPAFIDYGFVGSPALIGGQVYFTANENTSGPPPWPDFTGMKLYRIASAANDQIHAEFVSRLPFAAPDGSLNTFFETSLAETAPGHILAFFRTPKGLYTTTSTDSGKTWDTPAPFTAQPNAPNTKADVARSPSGRLVLAFNRSAKGRRDMCVAISSDGGKTWPDYYVFDDRGDPGTSYPNVAFGGDAAGHYDGNIYVAYDHGRGRTPPAYNKEITIAKIPEASVLDGHPVNTRYVVSK